MSDRGIIKVAELILGEIKDRTQYETRVWQSITSMERVADEITDKIKRLDMVLEQHELVRWETTKQVARRLRYSEQTIRNLAHRGIIRGYRFEPADDWRFDAAEVDEAVKSLRDRGRTVEGADVPVGEPGAIPGGCSA